MKLEINSGKQERAQRVVLYGVEGIGKTTAALCMPDPLYIDLEDGSGHMDVKRLQKPTEWAQFLALVLEVARQKPCATLVIDTADWAEQLCIKAVCAKSNKTGIEDFGYGKGYIYLAEEWQNLLNALDKCISSGIHVMLCAHAMMRKFEQPDELGAYDRWELKLSKKVAPLTKEWSDMLLFYNYKTNVVKDKDGHTTATGGKRVIYTQHHPCWDAKNRLGLQAELTDFREVAKWIPANVKADAELNEALKRAEDAGVPVTDITPQPKKTGRKHKTPYEKLSMLMKHGDVMIAEESLKAVVCVKMPELKDKPLKEWPDEAIERVINGWGKIAPKCAENAPF